MFTSSSFLPLAVFPHRHSAGFSLMEVMITLSIATILMSVAIPSFQTFTRTNRIAAITNQLSSSFQYARSEAVTRGKTVTVCKSNDVSDSTPTCVSGANWQDGWVVFVDDNGDGDLDTGETPLRVSEAINNTVLITTSTTNFANFVRFRPDGQSLGASIATGTLLICTAPEQRRIVFNAIGRLRIETGTCT